MNAPWWIYWSGVLFGVGLAAAVSGWLWRRRLERVESDWHRRVVTAEDEAWKAGMEVAEMTSAVMDLMGVQKLYEQTCAEMRHSLLGEGWTQTDLQTAWGERGSQTVSAEMEREDCVLVPAVFDRDKRCLGFVCPGGLTLTAHRDEGWLLMVEDSAKNLIGHLKWPEDWPETVNSEFLKGKGFEIL